MEYLYYLLAVLILGLVCMVSLRLAAQKSFKQKLSSGGKVNRLAQPSTRPVPTPWGWANHRERNGTAQAGFSDAMQSVTNRLMREKKLLQTRSTNPRVSGSVRALLEDRYGRVDKGGIPYEKVKKPLLRDPNQPYDQMDDFGGREAERIRARLNRLKAMNQENLPQAKREKTRYVDIKDIKQPWGW